MARLFKPGDRVVCVDPGDPLDRGILRVGATYTVRFVAESHLFVWLEGGKPRARWWANRLFRLASEVQTG